MHSNWLYSQSDGLSFIGVDEMEPEVARRVPREVEVVVGVGRYQREEGRQPLLARVARAPAVVLRSWKLSACSN